MVLWGLGTIDFCPALAALVSPVQKSLSSSFVPVAQQAVQAAVLRHLFLDKCLCT
jgi:hypothetical protein